MTLSRLSIAVAFLAASFSAAVVASAQAGAGPAVPTPLACDFKKAPVGSWAEYTTTVGGADPVAMQTRWAFLGRDSRGNTLELTLAGGPAIARLGGKVVTRMVLVPDPVGVSKPFRQLVMQMGDGDPVEVPLNMEGLPGQKFQNPDPKKLVGKETIKVAAGTFATSHYREIWEECTVDAWLNDQVPPLGVIKTRVTPTPGILGPGGKPMPPVTMELRAHGKAAKPAITRTPRPLAPGIAGND
jgi:hypothetical protein